MPGLRTTESAPRPGTRRRSVEPLPRRGRPAESTARGRPHTCELLSPSLYLYSVTRDAKPVGGWGLVLVWLLI